MPEIIDPVFAKTSQNARFLLSEYERFGLVFTKTSRKRSFSLNRKRAFWLVFAKTASIISGTGPEYLRKCSLKFETDPMEYVLRGPVDTDS